MHKIDRCCYSETAQSKDAVVNAKNRPKNTIKVDVLIEFPNATSCDRWKTGRHTEIAFT